MDTAFVAIVLFVMLMLTRRRLTELEKRARGLESDLEHVLPALKQKDAEHERRLRSLEQALESAAALQPPAAAEPALLAPPIVGTETASVLDRAAVAATATLPRALSPVELAPRAAGSGPGEVVAGEVGARRGAAQDRTPALGAEPVYPQDPLAPAVAFVRELLFGGNTVVRVGIVVLLVGVVLLLRWASENALLPIELRLTGAAALAIALVVVGYRQRVARPGFSVTLQGGGVAGLYLAIFFAFRTYALLPPALAFALLAGVALASGALAVLQDSVSLLFIAQVFGFLAPLLASTGQGSHVGLFSYYLVLNLVVAGVAWFKAWRSINLLGFAFTFGIASAWGVLRYEPQHFASTEPFLIVFFLLYVAIPVFFALRHPGKPGWVDGSLVFGTPLAALALQWALVHDRPFAMAFSALAMAAVYIGLVVATRRRAPERLALLGEAFLPIGVGFATLAIPYGLDDHNLTGAAWALEGAGLYWVGVRQKRWLSRAAGLVLQLLAGVALALDPVRPTSSLALLNTMFLASLLLGLSSLFVAAHAYRWRAQLSREWQIAQALIAWGSWFVLSAGFREISTQISPDLRPGVQVAWLGSVAFALERVAGARHWQPGRYPGLALWLAMIFLLGRHHYDLDVQPFARGGYLGWPIYALAMFTILRRFVPRAGAWAQYAHPGALWLWTAFCISLADQLTADAAGLDRNYIFAASLATLVAVVLGILMLAPKQQSWPVGHEPVQYVRVGLTGVVALLLLRILQADMSQPGSSSPLPYLPIANALDLTLLLGFAATFIWIRRGADVLPATAPKPLVPAQLRLFVGFALAALAFVSWNALLARTVHHYAHVAWDPDELWDAVPLQVAFSLSWTLIALGLMIFAHRRVIRPAWITGASLLGLVVVKLFVLDLAELSSGAKIGTFLGVGLLLLLIGALAPVPPTAAGAPPVPRPSQPPEAHT